MYLKSQSEHPIRNDSAVDSNDRPRGFQVDAKYARSENTRAQSAAPLECLFCARPFMGASFDKTLQEDVVPDNASEMQCVLREVLPVQEDVPSAIPVQTRRRTAQPHCIAIAKTKRGEDTCTGVGHQGRIEVPQPAATDEDSNYKRRRGDNGGRPAD